MSEKLKKLVNKNSNRNWVRAALSLRSFKQGIENFIDTQISCHHADLLKRLQDEKAVSCLQCGQCTSKNLLPDHSKQKKCIQKNRRHCFCSQPTFRRQCPNKICSLLYDYIVKAHNTNDPLWTNTNPTNWLTDYWELGRCFLSSPGYVDKQSAADTDAIGLLSIAINDIYIQDRMDTDIESLAKVRDIRNLILHSASFSLDDDDEVIKYIDEMIHVLQDKKAFTSDTSSKDAIRHLNELKNVQCHISFDDELKVREESLKAIEEMTRDAVNTIRSTETNVLDAFKLQQDQIKDLIKRHETNFAEQKDINEQAAPMAEDTKSTSSDKEKRKYIQDKQHMKEELVRLYKQFFIKTDVTPYIPEVQVDVDSVYVPPQLYSTGDILECQHEYYNIYGDVKNKIRLSERDFFANIVKTNILLIADAGKGKTSLCYNIISAWCAAHESASPQSSPPSISTEEKTAKSHSWSCYVRDIEFLFFISLKYCENQSSIEEMILKHLVDDRYRDTLYKLLQTEEEKCLIILDDLNEWSPAKDSPKSPTFSQGIPRRQLKSRYATIYTTRPWKLTTIRPKSGEFHMIVELEDMDQESSIQHIHNVSLHLNKMTRRRRYTEDFLARFKDKSLTYLKRHPLLSKFLLCLWYEKSKLDMSLAGIYSSIIDSLINQSYKKGTLSYPDKYDEKQSTFLKAFADKESVKISFDTVILPLALFAFRLCQHQRRFCYIYETNDLSRFELNQDKLQLFSNIGILSERISYGQSVLKRCKTVSFVHDTFYEFFVAVFLSIHPNEISRCCKTPESILRMGLVFRFLSGLNFCSLQIISHRTLSIIDNDKNSQDYRCGISSYKGLAIEMQRMLSCCIEEGCRSGIKMESLALRDVYLGKSTVECMSSVCGIDFRELRTLYCDIKIPMITQTYIAKARRLEMLACTSSEYLTDIILQNILRNNESTLRCLQLSKICLKDIQISADIFQKLRRLMLSETELKCDQFVNLITNSRHLEEVQLNLVTVSTNGDDKIKPDESDTMPIASSIKHLNLRMCCIVSSCFSIVSSIESLNFNNSSLKLLTELLRKCTKLTEVAVHNVTFESDEEITSSFSKLTCLMSLLLNSVVVSVQSLSKMLNAIGNLPTQVEVKLSYVRQDEGIPAKDLLQYLDKSKLCIRKFDTSDTLIMDAVLIFEGTETKTSM